MKVTLVPAHVGFVPPVTAIVTEGVNNGLTTKVIPVEVAVGVLAQMPVPTVITQVITPPVVPASVYVAPMPTLFPSFFH